MKQLQCPKCKAHNIVVMWKSVATVIIDEKGDFNIDDDSIQIMHTDSPLLDFEDPTSTTYVCNACLETLAMKDLVIVEILPEKTS